MFRSRTAGLAVIRGTFRDFFRDECLQMAAALSFYTLWALPPLMIILIGPSIYSIYETLSGGGLSP